MKFKKFKKLLLAELDKQIPSHGITVTYELGYTFVSHPSGATLAILEDLSIQAIDTILYNLPLEKAEPEEPVSEEQLCDCCSIVELIDTRVAAILSLSTEITQAKAEVLSRLAYLREQYNGK